MTLFFNANGWPADPLGDAINTAFVHKRMELETLNAAYIIHEARLNGLHILKIPTSHCPTDKQDSVLECVEAVASELSDRGYPAVAKPYRSIALGNYVGLRIEATSSAAPN